MKRILYFSLFVALTVAPWSRGQDTQPPGAVPPSRQEAEENYKALAGHVQDLIDAKLDQDKKITELQKEIHDLREQLAKPAANNYATKDDLKRVEDAIKTLDEKRVADDKKMLADISDQIAKLGSMKPVPPPARIRESSTPTPPVAPEPAVTGEGYWYTVKPNDTYSKIAKIYTDQNIKVTAEQIAAANPKIKPTGLQVDQKVWVPAPKTQPGKMP